VTVEAPAKETPAPARPRPFNTDVSPKEIEA
jgi:hypothetical protein